VLSAWICRQNGPVDRWQSRWSTDMAMIITAASNSTALIDLPWSVPLSDWPEELLIRLPQGLSRHVVRFVRVGGTIYAVKELGAWSAEREYQLLRGLARLGVPSVEVVGVVTDRAPAGADPLEAVVITRHLQFALPYRALFSRTVRPDTLPLTLDALAALLVRLHMAGFFWGDVSLSNVLFRRDAEGFVAYLVDAETGELHDRLTDGQRLYDLDVARTNIIGELMDLEAGGLLDVDLDPFEIGETIVYRYLLLWAELTEPETVADHEHYRIEQRVRRLNDLGFDVGELNISTGASGQQLRIQPTVVDPGHHQRRLLRLTGLDAEENQARRLLGDLDRYRAQTGQQDQPEDIVAHRWLDEVFEPVLKAVPRNLRNRIQQAQLFHEFLEHRWFLSERAGRDVGADTAIASYVKDVLAHQPDEEALIAAAALVEDEADNPYLT
jgi:Domain of unknown function (DUF4032)/Lipopolysaccharide kinase (Kdo/WaaP) family